LPDAALAGAVGKSAAGGVRSEVIEAIDRHGNNAPADVELTGLSTM
jgi:hypothetical protein